MRRLRGIAAVLGSVLCFGLMPIWAKQAYQAGLGPFEVLSLRTVLAALFLGCLLALRGRSPRLEKRCWRIVAAVSALYAAMMLSFYEGCRELSAGASNALFHLYPVFVVVFEVAGGKRRLSATLVSAVLLSVGGLAALALGESAGLSPAPVLIVLVAAVLYAAYSLLLDARSLAGVDPLVLTFWICAFSGAGSTAAACLSGHVVALPTLEAWAPILALALLSTVVAVTLYNLSVRLLGPTTTTIMSNAEIAVTVIMGVALLNEAPTASLAVGCCLIVASCILSALPKGDKGLSEATER